MRKIIAPIAVVVTYLISAQPAIAQCTKIKDGTITGSGGDTVTLGYDKYGYNYQAHMFNGLYENYVRPATVVTEGAETLVMKWSDDWLSNLDCSLDGKLDRGLDPKTGVSDGISKGWVTNHFEGDYQDSGEVYHYTYFVKIVWVGAATSPDPWEGKRIWDQYAIIEEVYNDPHAGFHGNDRSKLAHPAGFGAYK